jgi:uncharacterized cupredoxin-like copper-binding protein
VNARRLMIAVVVAGLVAAGCSSSSKSADSDTTTPTTAAPKELPKVTITATDFAYDVPAQIPAGYVDVTIKNDGKEQHQVGFVKLGSTTFAQFKTAANTTNLNAVKATTFAGGPNGAEPGQTTSAIVKLDPGAYAVVCLIPANSDGKPHAEHGMIKAVTVAKTDESIEVAPKVASTIKLNEFSFTLPPAFDGKGTVDIANEGAQVHELVIVKLKPGKTLADAKAFLLVPPGTPPPAGPPPFTAIPGLGGVTGLSSQQHAWLNMNLTPGNYALICFFPDTSNALGLPHALKGMTKEFTIS